MTDLDLARYFARHLLAVGPLNHREDCRHCGAWRVVNYKTWEMDHTADCEWPRIEAECKAVLADESPK